MNQFAHVNFNVLDLNKSLEFYKQALGLKQVREINADDGSFRLVYLGDGNSDFQLELTWMRDRTEAYDLGEAEFYLAIETDNYEAMHELHLKSGWICFENPAMGIYFINDPYGYWLEIVPQR